ncbi:MAG: asparagine synthase-related protein [Gammaproteobacteria bacterium]|nr:asparagine synthase-related protein [Gammaproteobacteria bacterium]
MSKLHALQNRLEDMGPVAVAVSGGVDSMTLAWVAHTVNPDSQMFHALSPAVPTQATDRVKQYAEREGWNLHLVDAGEVSDPDYIANPANALLLLQDEPL